MNDTPLILSTSSGSGPIDFKPLFQTRIKDMIADNTHENFDRSHDPRGKPWVGITQYTLRHRKYNKGPEPLVDTKELYEAAMRCSFAFINEHSFGITTLCDHAEIHQYGGTNAAGYPVPQRQFRGWNDQMIAETKRLVGAYAAAVLRARGRRAG